MLVADVIVFTQKELENAVNSGFKAIMLCDNKFELPVNSGITYTAIGKVAASIALKNPEAYGIICDNFVPKTSKKTIYANVLQKTAALSNSYSSHINSFSTSYRPYRLGSHASSYLTSYYYKYSNNSSFRLRTSYSTASSYRLQTSYAMASSYKIASSYRASFMSAVSFVREFRKKLYKRVLTEISVNGYGIHLI